MVDASPWPQFRRRAEKILAEVVTAEVAGDLAGMLEKVALSSLPVPEEAGEGFRWPALVSPAADPEDLSDEEKAEVAKRFAAGEGCTHCGGLHLRACPRVRRLVLSGDAIAEVEFWRDGQWPTGDVLWPEDFPPGNGDGVS